MRHGQIAEEGVLSGWLRPMAMSKWFDACKKP